MKISQDSIVTIEYTLKNVDGEVLDTTSGDGPIAYLHGHGNLIEGLEEALEGKQAGDQIATVVPPEKGYGSRSDELVEVVPKGNFPQPEELEVGSGVVADTEDGESIFWVLAVDDENVTLDGNHPLADKELHFEVKVVEVREATDEELEHGHVLGEGDHQH